MEEICKMRAKFKGLNAQEGKTIMQFALDPEDKAALPRLVTLTGSCLQLELSTDQLVMPIDAETGEVVEEVECQPMEDQEEVGVDDYDWPALPAYAGEYGGEDAA